MYVEVENPSNIETTKRLERQDSLFGDAEKVSNITGHGSKENWTQVLHLAFLSIGIIYGDVGTSPLYVYSSTFPNGIKNKDDLLGVLSLILYTLILIPMIKYVFIVLYADDNGDGGTFALYSLISRYAKIRLIPNQQVEDSMVSNYSIESPSLPLRRAQWLKDKFESSKAAKIGLFTITILGTSMVMGDGTLTPAISVLSAVSGIREKVPSLTETQVVWISVPILFMLFSVQRFGTDKVGYSFAPIISVWFVLIAGIGMYNIMVYEIGILRAFNPMHILYYFRRNGKEAWVSLGGAILCVTGTEGMYADLGHFNIRAIQLHCCFVPLCGTVLHWAGSISENISRECYGHLLQVYPSAIVLANLHHCHFFGYHCKPSNALWCILYPLQGPISGLLPQGICVVTVFSITTHLMTVVMLLVWKKNIIFILLFYVVFSSIEWIYLSSILSKFIQGGYLPFCFALVLMALMVTWHYVHVMKYWYELDHIVPIDDVTILLEKHNVRRIPGVGLLYSELVQGIPPVFLQLVQKIPSVHSVFLFMSIKHLPIPHVVPAERFLFRQVGPREHRMFRCVARYGYSETVEDSGEFARFLADRLKIFIEDESVFAADKPENEDTEGQTRPRQSARSVVHSEEVIEPQMSSHVGNISTYSLQTIEEEKQLIDVEMERGVVYLMGSANVIAGPKSSAVKKVVVNYVYAFLRRNLAEGHKVLAIPNDQLLKVGITYEI
ncbi:potassium transporter 1-like isoform X2 [Lolium rigidum]|uniref:potassium transporter 1-like isoform X2 n=1 Tax=Lolium rigidum TaxID=89674 RepID=UPI001F5CDA5D|nr:potassium transporter 1-like isoform X2 [Lolium rigidum]